MKMLLKFLKLMVGYHKKEDELIFILSGKFPKPKLPKNAFGGIWDEDMGEWIKVPRYRYGDISRCKSEDYINSKQFREMHPHIRRMFPKKP